MVLGTVLKFMLYIYKYYIFIELAMYCLRMGNIQKGYTGKQSLECSGDEQIALYVDSLGDKLSVAKRRATSESLPVCMPLKSTFEICCFNCLLSVFTALTIMLFPYQSHNTMIIPLQRVLQCHQWGNSPISEVVIIGRGKETNNPAGNFRRGRTFHRDNPPSRN